MKLFLTFNLLIIFSLFSSLATATIKTPTQNLATKIVNEYYFNQSTLNSQKIEHDNCNQPADPASCVDEVCDRLGQFSCDTSGELQNVANICRGVGGTCVDISCKKLSPFSCDSFSELKQITNQCRDVFDGRCLEVTCNKLGAFACDESEEINKISLLCKGRVEAGCIESVCNRLGHFYCDSFEELQQVTKTCSGRE
jgi:hypothetical protein